MLLASNSKEGCTDSPREDKIQYEEQTRGEARRGVMLLMLTEEVSEKTSRERRRRKHEHEQEAEGRMHRRDSLTQHKAGLTSHHEE